MSKNCVRVGCVIGASLLGWLLFSGQAKAGDFALSFDGVNDYVAVPDHPSLGFGTGDFSAELWFKTPGPPVYIMDFFIKISDDGNSGWGLLFYPSGKINFWTNNGDTTTGSGYNDNQWHQVVAAREGSQLKLYMDGVLQSTATENPISNVNVGGSLYIGGIPIFGTYLPGIIDEVRMYNRALAADEVSEHYTGLFSYELKANGKWHFGEGSGTTVADTSGNTNNGTVFGAAWVAGYVFPPLAVERGAPGYFKEGFPPEIKVITPQPGDAFSDLVTIAYSVIDPNDITGPPEFGLSNQAVSLHYSVDAGATWALITQNLSPVGRFTWNISNLPEGGFYSLKIVARDKSGQGDEEIVGPITIDRTPPAFDVVAEPAFSKGENVSITVKATEALAEAPTVFVTQRYYQDRRLQVIGRNDIWKGEYEIRRGFDGTAEIRVVGRDIAGNSGDVLRSGGFFNIGLNPPPTPLIIKPLDQEVVYESFISIEGKIRKDTKAVLFAGNERVKEVVPDSEGSFTIPNVQLLKTRDNGLNVFQIRSEDKGGNLSEAALLRITYNVLPGLQIISPKAGDVLQGRALVEFSAFDENASQLSFSIEVSRDQGQTWDLLARGLTEPSYVWDTRAFAEGVYILRGIADDGVDKVSATSSEFSVKNLRPTIAFEKTKTVSGTGSALVDDGVSKSPAREIVDVEYSLDGGIAWLEAEAKDGKFDSAQEPFSFEVAGFKEGIYEILVRARDSGGVTGEAKKILIVDFGPPPKPTISSPQAGAIFGFKQDLDPQQAGTQIKVSGRAEANNQIIVKNGELKFEGISDSNGNFELQTTLRDHGQNVLQAYSIDPAGNRSVSDAALNVIHNNPPDVRFLRPKPRGAIGGSYEIVFEIQDRDLDPMKQTSLSYRRLPGRTLTVLAENMEANTFPWDVSALEQGFYELILQATDGVSDNSLTIEFLIDNTAPEVNFKALDQPLRAEAITLEMQGNAADDFSGVQYVEYSIDNENWFKALISAGYQERQAAWRFKHPVELQDGSYEVRFRATDLAGNVSQIPEPQKILIDSIPPRIGSYIISAGPLILLPEGELFRVPAGTQAKFTVSLESDAKTASLSIGTAKIQLANKAGLWETEILLGESGEYKMFLTAKDQAGNEAAKREIGTIEVISRGKVISAENNLPVEGVQMAVQVFRSDDQSWVRWQAEAYAFSNPVFTSSNGEYDLLLPPGVYRIALQKTGFQRLKSSDFELINSQFVAFDFALQPRTGLKGFFENLLELITF